MQPAQRQRGLQLAQGQVSLQQARRQRTLQQATRQRSGPPAQRQRSQHPPHGQRSRQQATRQRSLQRASRRGRPLALVVPRCAQLHGLVCSSSSPQLGLQHPAWLPEITLLPRFLTCRVVQAQYDEALLPRWPQPAAAVRALQHAAQSLTADCKMPAGEPPGGVGFQDAAALRCCQAAQARHASQVKPGEADGEPMLSAILQALCVL